MAVFKLGFLGLVTHIQQIRELRRRQHEGVQDQLRLAYLGLFLQGGFKRFDFLVELQLGVGQVQISEALRVYKGQPLLSDFVIYQPQQEVGVEAACSG